MRFHWKNKSYIIKINKTFLMICVGFIILFCAMSSWQMHRYHFKKNMQMTYAERLKMLPKPLELIKDFKDLQFMPVAVVGEYVNHLTMFLQNKFYKGKQGVEVLTPLRIPGQNKLLLVDRGWVPVSHNALPILPLPKASQELTGYIKYYNEYQFILGKNILDTTKEHFLMQKIDIDEISKLTQKDFYPFILRLDPENPDGFVRDWVISTVNPERHLMYALQWLSFVFIVMIAFICFSIERVVYD